ncbi:MAG: M48 family metallopeptidase [Nostoc sp.]|uniref:M48 family metallopeptidase n=1 Tax=Nostoc sp. TaxID=1180 RepID=UPI002FFBC442
MLWNTPQFDSLIERTEKFARKHPNLYRLQVALFALLGYGYLLFMLVFLLSPAILVLGLVILKQPFNIWAWFYVIIISFPGVQFAIGTLPALLRNSSPIYGKCLSRSQFPKLFSLIDELQVKVKVTSLKKVLLTAEFNASVIQVPRLGIFGWYDNYLILGLPLVASLSCDELKAVLIHELAHLSGNHSQFDRWIYLLRQTLADTVKHMQQVNEGHPSIFITPFVKWYIPFFNAYSFVLARINEYDADKCALKLAGSETCAVSLIKMQLTGGFALHTFWPNLYQQVEHKPQPPADAYTKLLTALFQPKNLQESYKFLKQALVRKTNNIDTHPCLNERLKILDFTSVSQELISPCFVLQENAAEVLLGKQALQEFTLDLDKVWKQQVESSWRQRYAVVQEVLQEIKILEEKETQDNLSLEDIWKLANLSLEVNKEELAMQRLHQLLIMDSDNVSVHYLLGQILLKQGNLDGVQHLETALSQDVSLTNRCLQILYELFWQRGEVEKSNYYRDRLDGFNEQLSKAKKERSVVSHQDTFCQHGLEKTETRKIRTLISQCPQVKKAFLVQKVMNHFSNIPFFVLGIVRHSSFLRLESSDADLELTTILKKKLQIQQNWEIIVVANGNSKVIKKMQQIKQSLIYYKQ